MMWVKLCLDKFQHIYMYSFYRSSNTSLDPITEFKHLLSDILLTTLTPQELSLQAILTIPLYIRKKDWGILIQVECMDVSLTHYL